MKRLLELMVAASATSTFALGVNPVLSDLPSARVAWDDPSRSAYEAELLADADARANERGDDPTSGYIKNRFTIGDGNTNTLRIGGFAQIRYLQNYRDNRPEGAEDSFTHGFQIQRARLKLDGTVWDKHFSYNILFDMSNGNGSTVLYDAESRYTFDNKFYIRAGQYKPLFLREELVGDTNQLTVERSVTNATFTLNRSQGAGVGWSDAQFRLGGDFTDGGSQLNTAFNAKTEADYALTGRGEWMFAGTDFKRFDNFTSWRGNSFTGMWGAALDYESYGHTGPGTAGGAIDKDFFGATTDISFGGDGWNAYAAVIYRGTNVAGRAHQDDFGVVVQGGVFVTDQTELFARYDAVLPDDLDGPDNFNTVTAGANYYLSPQSQAAKITADVVYYIDAQSKTAIVPVSTARDLLSDPEGNQWGIRVQLQVVY